MANKKWYRVAVEGNTCDRRIIERSWLLDAAATYNREKYAARIWIEHIRGVAPDSQFGAYGDVLALKTDTVVIDGEQKLGLFAQIQPTPALVGLNKKSQKLYSSVEIDPDFASSGRAYLVGMGVTDTPASLGTELLTFAAANPAAHPYAARKFNANTIYTAAEAVAFSFDADEDEPTPPGDSLFNRVRSMLTRRSANDDARYSDVSRAVETVAQASADAAARVIEGERATEALRQEFADYRAATETRFTEMHALLDATPDGAPRRPPAAGGGDGGDVTDC
ncbi:GPO family capsid scaffolding protein [Lysobacter sp. CA199]|uniref:GPO family capsid scaffolding protein n=1 Tax=Lysobacter sp. CA199 TaxID=3455608 RepID=UPI003F8D3598